MKEQDLRDKFEDIEKMTFHNHLTVKTSTDQCVQIAKDYAEQEVRNAKLPYQLFIGKVINILGQEKTTELLKESKEAFKNKENER